MKAEKRSEEMWERGGREEDKEVHEGKIGR